MRTLLVFAGVSAVAALGWAQSQVQPITPPSGGGGNYYGYSGGYHSSTAAEGAMRGMADVVRSQGEANLSNSAAAINYSIARQQEIDNYAHYTNTYFQMREANRQYRAAERGPRPSMEDLVRYAQMGKPQPLSPSEIDVVSGDISWPMLLRDDAFAQERKLVEAAFANRSASTAMGFSDLMTVRKVTDTMLAQLKENVRDLPPNAYLEAKNFLESLAYEAGRPVG
jgi:hypothetical protein